MVFESLLTSTLTSTEYDQNTSGSGSVTSISTDSIDILTAAFTDAGFSFTLKKTTEYSNDAWSAAGQELPPTST
jgi:hypothetical protein